MLWNLQTVLLACRTKSWKSSLPEMNDFYSQVVAQQKAACFALGKKGNSIGNGDILLSYILYISPIGKTKRDPSMFVIDDTCFKLPGRKLEN
ncbi:hypothetical protein BUE76_00840 [Cnuella takakiae]|nr:hypothetical protein BUE76_00840 [Cnuella takakiae]